ncbi:MAG: helix-turn-helix domain-containing protein [Myxococcales bacterium]|jgi:excisionase family DNA binding protein
MVANNEKKPDLPAWIVASVADLPAFLTLSETAQYLRVSERQVYRLAETGRLVMVSKGGEKSRRLVPKASIVEYLRGLEAA